MLLSDISQDVPQGRVKGEWQMLGNGEQQRTDEQACKKTESLEWNFIKWARISFLEKGKNNLSSYLKAKFDLTMQRTLFYLFPLF